MGDAWHNAFLWRRTTDTLPLHFTPLTKHVDTRRHAQKYSTPNLFVLACRPVSLLTAGGVRLAYQRDTPGTFPELRAGGWPAREQSNRCFTGRRISTTKG